MNEIQPYWEVLSVLEAQFPEVSGYDFYREVFPDGAASTECHQDYSHPAAIFICYDEDLGYKVHHQIYSDTWDDDYMRWVEKKDCCVCGGLVYRGNRNLLNNAQRMNALIFDLDGVGEHEIRNLLYRFEFEPEKLRSLPVPTFLVASGTGVHLYYVFEEPIDLFPNIKVQMKSLKHDLTFKLWEYKATSRIKSIQYQSINQGFRMVGSMNEKHGVELRAFRTGPTVTLDYLNRYVIDKKNQVDVQKRFRPSKMSLEEAKVTWPEWYEKVIVNKERSLKKWNIGYRKKLQQKDFALYEWWLRQIEQIKGGHRYFFLMCLAIYACKCDVPKAKLKADLEEAYRTLKAVEHTNPMKREDIKSALEAYSKEYYNFTIADIEKLTEVRIERNKRNRRAQKDHIRRITLLRDADYPNGEWRYKGGAPTKKEIVAEYRAEHPEASKADCIRATGLSKPTVYKWWDYPLQDGLENSEKL